MSKNVKYTMLLILIALTCSAALTLCGNNLYHRKYSTGIITVGGCRECHGGIMGKTIILCTGIECLYTRNHSILHSYSSVYQV